MKRISALLLALLILLSLAACGKEEEGEFDLSKHPRSEDPTDLVEIKMADGGIMVIALDPEAAPETCENFKELVSEGFYNGLTFHRIIPGFMIQGGDPEGTGMGGSEHQIRGEFSSNGVENPLEHLRGTVSMARAMDPDSASSQFFICHKAASHLDGDYAAFGQLVDGFDTLDAIAKTPTGPGDYPLEPQVMEEVFFLKP